MDVTALQTELSAEFAAHGVRVAYLFGSQARGRARPDSDVDIAVLFGRDVPPESYVERRLDLIGAMMRVFQTNEVDVVVLNEAPPLLAVEVLEYGRILYNVDDALRIDFQVRALQEYRDTAPLRRLLAEALEDRVREGRFGKPVPFVPLVEGRQQC